MGDRRTSVTGTPLLVKTELDNRELYEGARGTSARRAVGGPLAGLERPDIGAVRAPSPSSAIRSSSHGGRTESLPPDTSGAHVPPHHVLCNRLNELGLTVVRSLPHLGSGVMPTLLHISAIADPAGLKNNLNLIVSLLQRAGIRDEHVQRLAAKTHDALVVGGGPLSYALSTGQAVHTDRHNLQALVEHMRQGSGESKVPPMFMMSADEHGAPQLYDLLNDRGHDEAAGVPHDAVVFMESFGCLEAVANTSGRPWSAVLQQLRMAPGQPDSVRNAAWLQHCRGEIEILEISTVDPTTGQLVTLEWDRGVHAGLDLFDAIPNPSPLKRAMTMAHLQAAADRDWEALENGTATYMGKKSAHGVELHWFSVPPSGQYEHTLPSGEHIDNHITEAWVREGQVENLVLYYGPTTQYIFNYDSSSSP